MLVRRSIVEADLVVRRGLPTTSVLRTLADLATHRSLTEAIVVADAALHMRRVKLDHLRGWAESNSRRRGIRRLCRVIELAEPATESPMETRLRMVLISGGLPRPQVQVRIRDENGFQVGRPDLYYPAVRLGIEYDGAIHRYSLAEDNRRQNLLLGAGVRLLRFTAADVTQRPETIVAQVRAMLAAPLSISAIAG
jgi:very-short-patch-repair endonuclease